MGHMIHQNITILNSKEKKEFLKKIEEQWGTTIKGEYGFLKDAKGKIFIMNKDVSRIDDAKLRINSLGLYIAEWKKNLLRLSIEGSQLVGKNATKNIVEISKEEAQQWLMGEDIPKEGKEKGFVILKNGNDFYGCGLLKEGVLQNYVGKNRRISAAHI